MADNLVSRHVPDPNFVSDLCITTGHHMLYPGKKDPKAPRFNNKNVTPKLGIKSNEAFKGRIVLEFSILQLSTKKLFGGTV